MLTLALIGIVIGLIAGFLSGLLGIGSGVVLVPMLLAVLAAWGEPSDVIMHHAVLITLFSMIFITAASTRAHASRGSVVWPFWRQLVPGMIIGGAIGAFSSQQLPDVQLQQLFAVFLFWVAWRMLQPETTAIVPDRTWRWWLGVGLTVGVLAGLLGLGGGILLVPILLRRGLTMAVAAGTSVACALPTVIAGAVMNGLFFGASVQTHGLGIMDLVLSLSIGLAGIISASWGTAAAHRWSPVYVRRAFVVLIIVLAVKLLLRS